MARCFGGLERETSLPYSTQAPLTLFHKVYWYGNNFYSRSVTAVSCTALSGASSMLLPGVRSCFICSRCSSCQWPAVFVLSLLCLPACFVGFQYLFLYGGVCVFVEILLPSREVRSCSVSGVSVGSLPTQKPWTCRTWTPYRLGIKWYLGVTKAEMHFPFFLRPEQGTAIDAALLASVRAGAAAGPAPSLLALARWGGSVDQADADQGSEQLSKIKTVFVFNLDQFLTETTGWIHKKLWNSWGGVLQSSLGDWSRTNPHICRCWEGFKKEGDNCLKCLRRTVACGREKEERERIGITFFFLHVIMGLYRKA